MFSKRPGSLSYYLGQVFFFLDLRNIIFFTWIRPPQQTYWFFIPIMILIGLGNAFLSGVIQTWSSNNYHYSMREDKDRRIYEAIVVRVNSIQALLFGGFIIFGSSLVFQISRNFAFEIN